MPHVVIDCTGCGDSVSADGDVKAVRHVLSAFAFLHSHDSGDGVRTSFPDLERIDFPTPVG